MNGFYEGPVSIHKHTAWAYSVLLRIACDVTKAFGLVLFAELLKAFCG